MSIHEKDLTAEWNTVLSPSYYNKESTCVCGTIGVYELSFYHGNIVKYILRSEKRSCYRYSGFTKSNDLL